jgi:hypothetical protein
MEKLIHQGNSDAICFRAVYLIPEQVSVAAAFSIDNTKVQLFFAGVHFETQRQTWNSWAPKNRVASQKSGQTHPEITRHNGESRPQNSFLFSPTATQKHEPIKLG